MDFQLPIGFARPHWLLLFALLPLFWWIERRTMVALGPKRRRWSRILRMTLVTLIVLALAGLQIVRISDQLSLIFAVDRSDSAHERFEETLDQINVAMASMSKNDRAGLIVFGGDAYVEQSPQIAPNFDKVETLVDSTHTDIARAIRLGLGLFPDDTQRRLVLVTDGNENLGDAMREATTAAANGVPIDVISLDHKVDEEMIVEEVAVPPSTEKDEPFEVKITIRSTVDGPAKLRLFKNGEPVGSRDIELSRGKNVYTFTETQADEGFYTYEVTIESLFDTMRENNNGAAYVRVFGKPRVLLVGRDGDRDYLARALNGQNWEVEESYDLPHRRAQFEDYDTIILDNAPSDDFSAEQLALLRDYVRDQAGGFIHVGGENSFALGFYARTPVEEALPVNLELSNKRHFPSLSMALVVDKSGSMAMQTGAQTKLELAVQACIEAVKILTPRDQIMVIAFDGSPSIVESLAPVGNNRASIVGNIAGIRPGGGTDMYPAFQAAYDALVHTNSQLKHIVLLTDGMTNPGAFDTLATRAAAAQITVSTVGVGPDADTRLLETIAGFGGGRFYHALDAYSLPRIFARETYIAQRAYLIEEPFIPSVFQENQIIKGITGFPEVEGYVVTEAKDRAEIVLLTHKGDPLLAAWRFGLGKSVAFTSDAKARWLQNWIGWEGFNKFWPQAVRWVLRNQERSELHPTVAIENGRGTIVVDAVTEDDQFINFLELRGRVSMPEGSGAESQDVELRQTAPGRYEGEFEARESGAYLARIYGAEEQGVMPATAGEIVSYPPEYRDLDPNMLLLNNIVDKTGGRLDPALSDLFLREKQNAKRRFDMWFWLLLAAAILFPLDIAIRRIYLDEEQMAAVRAYVRRFVPTLRGRGLRSVEGHEATMDALRRTKKEVHRRRFRREPDAAAEGAPAADTSSGAPPVSAPAPAPRPAMPRATSDTFSTTPHFSGSHESAGPRPAGGSSDAEPAEGDGDMFSRLRQATRTDSRPKVTPPSWMGGGAPKRPAAGGGGNASPDEADKPKPFIAPSARPAADAPKPAEDDPDLAGLSYTERLLRARKKARGDQ